MTRLRPCLRMIISSFLPAGRGHKKGNGEIFIRRLGEDALRCLMKFLSGAGAFFVPYLDILPMTLNNEDNAEDCGYLKMYLWQIPIIILSLGKKIWELLTG